MSERQELVDDIVEQAKIAVPWMVKTLRHATDELHEGNYSPELKHAIALSGALEALPEKESDAV